MENRIIEAVRITQSLKDSGWIFIDNGYNNIDKAVNQSLDEEVVFGGHGEFIDWLFKQPI